LTWLDLATVVVAAISILSTIYRTTPISRSLAKLMHLVERARSLCDESAIHRTSERIAHGVGDHDHKARVLKDDTSAVASHHSAKTVD
jgi:hypothetical protein